MRRLALALLLCALVPLAPGGEPALGVAHAIASTSTTHAIVAFAATPSDPRYAAMRSGHASLLFLWRERGTVFVGLFADGTHEIVGEGLPAGVSVDGLRRAVDRNAPTGFGLAVIGTGGRILHGGDRPLPRATLLALVSGTVRTIANGTPTQSNATAQAKRARLAMPVPRMRPLPAPDPITTAVVVSTAPEPTVVPALDRTETASVADPQPNADALPVPTAITLRWANAAVRAAEGRRAPDRAVIVPRRPTIAVPVHPLDDRTGLPQLVTLVPSLPPAALDRVRDEYVRRALLRMAPHDGFERAMLRPPGLVTLARLRFQHGRAVRGGPPSLGVSTTCDRSAAPPSWIARVDRTSGALGRAAGA